MKIEVIASRETVRERKNADPLDRRFLFDFSELLSERVRHCVVGAAEEPLGKLRCLFGAVALAREDIQVRGVGLVGEVSADAGSFDKLNHRESRHLFVLAEVHHCALPEALHLNALAELYHKLLDCFRGADGLPTASVDVD